jgi:hypothetical protein
MVQFKAKRQTAWKPPVTPSEAASVQRVDAAVAEQIAERVDAATPTPVVVKPYDPPEGAIVAADARTLPTTRDD